MSRRTLDEIQSEAGSIAWFIRDQRKSLGYTQEEFAMRVGVGLRFLKELELGHTTARMDKVNQVLNYLGYQLGPIPLEKTES